MEPLARYPVKTPAWIWPVILATIAIAAVAAVEILRWPMRGDRALQVVAVVVCVGFAALPIVLSSRYRVGEATIDLYADRVEVPRPWRGRRAFPLRSLQIGLMDLVQQVTVLHLPTGATLDRGRVVTLTFERLQRQLADRVFADATMLDHFLADLAAISRGEPARGPNGWKAVVAQLEAMVDPTTRPRQDPADDKFAAQLDGELANDDD